MNTKPSKAPSLPAEADYNTYLNMLVATSFLLAGLDALEGTTLFRQLLKQKAKQFRDELIKQTDKDINGIWGIEDDTYFSIIEAQEKLLKEIATMRPEENEVMLEIINRYKLTPEAFHVWLGIKIIPHEEKQLIHE